MQVPDVVWPGYVIRVAGRGRDVAVETLAQVRNRERPPGAERCVELEQRPHGCRRIGRHGAFAAAAKEPVGIRGFKPLSTGGGNPYQRAPSTSFELGETYIFQGLALCSH